MDLTEVDDGSKSFPEILHNTRVLIVRRRHCHGQSYHSGADVATIYLGILKIIDWIVEVFALLVDVHAEAADRLVQVVRLVNTTPICRSFKPLIRQHARLQLERWRVRIVFEELDAVFTIPCKVKSTLEINVILIPAIPNRWPQILIDIEQAQQHIIFDDQIDRLERHIMELIGRLDQLFLRFVADDGHALLVPVGVVLAAGPFEGGVVVIIYILFFELLPEVTPGRDNHPLEMWRDRPRHHVQLGPNRHRFAPIHNEQRDHHNEKHEAQCEPQLVPSGNAFLVFQHGCILCVDLLEEIDCFAELGQRYACMLLKHLIDRIIVRSSDPGVCRWHMKPFVRHLFANLIEELNPLVLV